jgi:alpha-2-macroglobulin
MNRMKGLNNLTLAARWRLAAAYYLAGKKDVAENLINNQATDIKPYKELSYSYGSAERDKAMILETLNMLGRKKDAKIILDELAKDMASDRWYSTQTTAYTLLAVAKFVGITGSSDQQLSYEYALNDKAKQRFSGKSPLSQIDLNIKGTKGGKISVQNTGDKTLFIKVQLEGIPSVGDKTNAENSLGMNVRYLGLDEVEIDPATLRQGTDFIAEVQITHPGMRDDYKEMALTQIFPSGWEIRNFRMDETQSAKIADQPRYQDIRDDRVFSYFDLTRSKKKTFRVLLNAAYIGEYYLPTVYCEAMYDNEINARRAGKWVKVFE